MRTLGTSGRPKKPSGASPSNEAPSDDLVSLLSRKVIGQPAAMQHIVPYVEMFRAGLSPEGRPAGVFLLLGPTGTGKTKTVEALADVLHGSEKNLLRVDCGEYQMEHEVAKLIGAPPGYLGHRETQPMLTQQKLNAVTSDHCGLSIVLFDEIEKAAPSMLHLLLGILDRATLRLGDNTAVNFENSVIFLTSNLGAREMMKELRPEFGFQAAAPRELPDLSNKLESIVGCAVRRKFSPEFVNRIDAVITYQPLGQDSLAAILDQQICELQRHVNTRLGDRCFDIEVPLESRQFLLRTGTSPEYGARELRRTIHRQLTQPLATMVAAARIEPGACVRVEPAQDQESLLIRALDRGGPRAPKPLTVLLVDDNRELVRLLERWMAQAGWRLVTAQSAQAARELAAGQAPNAVLLDYLLPDGNGVDLGVVLQRKTPRVQVILMTGTKLSPEEEEICRKHDFPVLRKPFLAGDIVNLLRARLLQSSAAGV